VTHGCEVFIGITTTNNLFIMQDYQVKLIENIVNNIKTLVVFISLIELALDFSLNFLLRKYRNEFYFSYHNSNLKLGTKYSI
jgi:hypothetical protein